MVQPIEERRLKPLNNEVLPFEALKDAYRAQVAPDHFCKVVLDLAA